MRKKSTVWIFNELMGDNWQFLTEIDKKVRSVLEEKKDTLKVIINIKYLFCEIMLKSPLYYNHG